MAKNIQVLVNTGNPENNKTFEVVQGSGAKGKPTTIKAVKGARYQLEELTAKSTGPENIRSKRVGKNLHVMLDGSSAADLIVENYYDEDMLTENNRGLYGRAEDGKMYEYIPEDPTPEGLPINLADGGRPVSQVLGGLQIGEAFELSGLVLAAAGGGFGALTAGAAAVGAAALAGGGGGGGATTDTAAAALASIKAAAENNTATSGNLAATVFTAAGVTGVDANNLAAIQSALDSAAVNGNAADTKEEVQAIVDAYNAIKANADGTPNNNATNPTQAQYAAIGVTGVDTATEESLLGDAIDGKPFSAVDTVAEVQTLANAAAAVMTGATGGTAPTKAQLEALGITGVTDANLAAVQAAIANNTSGAAGVDTLSELQAVTTAAAAAAALASIKAAAENNTATSGNLAATVFSTAGVTGVDANNLAAIQSALDSAAVNGVAADTKEEVQAIVDAYNAIKANADGTANNNATNPTQAQYAAIGVTGVDTATEESLLGDAIDGKPFSAVDTVAEVQTLANAAAAVMTGAAGGTAPTKAQLEALGITGVTDANLAAVQAAIAATDNNGTGVDTLSELQAVANTGATNAANAAAALITIAAAAQANNASDSNVAVGVFVTAGITGVDANNIAAIQSALNDADVQGGQAETAAKVQAIVDAYNAVKANADTAATANTTTAQYAAIGINGIDTPAKTSLLGDVVDSKNFADVDTVPELQALAVLAAAVITGAAGGTPPTKAQLEALGITGVTDANLVAVQESIARTADDGIGVDTLAELQAVVTIGADAAAAAAAAAVAAAREAIRLAAENNNATDANVAASVFATAGVTGVDSTNVAAIQSALNSANVNGLATDTLVEVQNIVNAYNAIRENADGTANNYASNPTQTDYALIGVTGVDTATEESLLGDAIDGKPFSAVDSVPEVQALANAAAAVMTGAAGGTAPTKAQLEALGITGVTDANLAAVLAAIAATDNNGTGVDTLSELQAVATAAAAAAAALDAIKTAAEGNTATSGNLAASVFTAAGVTGVTPDNLAAIQSALDSAAVNGNAADTKEEVQAIVDAYNAIKANADGTPNNNATNPTQAQYAAIGVTGVDTATEESLLGDAIDGKPFSAVDTVAEVQALADAAAAVIASTTGGTAPTQAQLVALGITGVTPANLAAVQAAIANNASGAAGVDTLSELQAVTDAATATAASNAALELIKNAAEGNTAGTTPSVTDFVTAGITGVDSNNFAAINSALNSGAVNGAAADTKGEVQAIVDAYKAIKDNADTPATANATAAQYTAVGVTGIDNSAKANLLGDVVDGKDFADVDTVPELQALATAAAAVIAGATGGTAPTQAQLNALGITGVTPANLAAVQAAIAATGNGGAGVDTLSELQTVVTNAAAAAAATAAALSTIAAAAQANDATNANVGTGVFATAGITGVDVNNIAAIQSALNDTDVQSGQADTAAKVQTVVNAYNAIKANADTPGTANATQEQYAAIGVNGIDNAAKTSLLGDVVDTKAFGDVDTVAKVQALANLAAVVINSAGTGTAPTKEQLEALGITGVTDANLADIQAAIAATADDGTGVDTLSELQAVANAGATNAANAAAAAAALSTIAAAAQANDATNTNVAASVFATAGVTGVDSTNVAAIQSALNSAAVVGTSVDTLGEVQAVVDAYKAILAEANDTANTAGNGTADANPASNPTAAQYAAIGVNLGSATTDAATDPETLALLNAIVGGKQAADVGTVADVQALATIANAIQLQATGVTPNPALTIADLQKIGLDTTGVTTNNLPALLAAIALKNDNGSETDTLEKLQALIGTLDKVAPVAVNDTSSATEDALIQTGNVKTNDTSLDTTETFAIVGSNVGSYGTLVLTSSGAYTYTYNTGIIHAITTNVTDTFTYRVTDAAGNTSTATLDVTVTPVNDAATFSGDISKATFETNVAQTITGQLNVADIDSATTVVVQTNVAGSAGLGKFTINTAGAWSYVMDSAQNQLKPADVITDSLTVSTADGTTQIISVVITGTNDAPIVANALADTTATATVAITNYVVPANAFSDVDSTSLTYTATLADGSALSTVGLSFDATTRTVSGTPSAGTAGSTLSVKVTASDGSLSAFDTFDIVVASPDSIAPTLLSSSPADNGTVAYANVANDLTLTFSEAVQKGTGLIELYNASNTLVESFDVATSTKVTGWNGSTLTINPTANLAAGTGYYVKVATTAIKDLANNAYAGITDATTLNFTVSAGAGSVINLGADGKLIAPVQVEGKWYYYWDRTGDGASGITDRVTHDVLDTIFKYDLNGAERPVGVTDTNDVYRYATINGVQVSLPTLNGNMSYPLTGVNTAAVGGGATNSSTYDELSAVWDNFPYSPTWYTDGVYWSATKAPGQYHDAISMADGSNYGTATGTADTNAWWVALQVVAANAAPVLADTVLTLTGVSAGAAAPVNGNTTAGDLVSTLVGGITDADAGATKGIAITGVHSNGTLYYSVDGGTTWLTATGVSDTNALLLAADSNTRVYYKANGTTGTISDAITFRAWDMTANITEGVYTSTAANGGKAQFSELSDTVSVQVVKPVTINNVSTDNIIVLNESIPLTGTANANATVNLSINGTARSVVADASGNWSYDTKSVDLVRYVMVRKPLNGTGGAYDPNGIFSIDELKVMVNGVDVAAGKQVRIGTGTTSAGFVNYLTDGTTGYFETGPGTATDAWVEIDLGAQYRVDSVYVTPRTGWSMRLNDAKVFTGLTEQYGASTARLISTGNSTITNVASTDNTPVSVVQPNGGDKDPINVGANTITATQTVSGVTSNASKTVTSKNTIGIIDTYLNATDKYVHDGELICGDTTPLLRGVLEAPLTGTQKVAIWSTTGGVAAQVNYATVNGVYWEFQLPALTVGTHTYEALLVASPGGVQLATSYTYTVVVGSTPLALDLNGDGVQTLGLDAGVQFDLLNTGKKVNVGWVSQQDGLLAMDINGDGAINSGAELFGEQTVLADGTLAKNGWEALAAQDTNADGTIDAQDANFNQLRVWVDADSDGTTDAGELRALADESITSISLNHDNSSVQQNGNVVEMASTFTTTDGAVHTVADVGFQVQNATSSVFKLTSGNTLDLSGLGNASLVNTIDMATDAAANTVKLSLADVLSVATDASIANGVHKLTLTGDANDTVELDLSQWANTGNTVTEGDHTYAVYNASSAAAAQLLIDQHMVLANHG